MSEASSPRKSEQSTVTATGATTPLQVQKGERFTLSVSGITSATVAFQRCLDGTNYRTVESYTADTEKDGIAAEDMLIRLNCTVYATGTIVMRVGR